MVRRIAKLTDYLEHFWEHTVMQRAAGNILVFTYLGMILLIELNRQGWLPAVISEPLPETHFFAVEVAFTLLLVTEVVSLIFGLTRSFSRSIGIQIEILSLILLRDTFKRFTYFGEPIVWADVGPEILPMIADSLGALAIFIILGIYYRNQRSRAITDDEREQAEFIAYKKLIALGLIVTFTFIGVFDLVYYFRNGVLYPFFETFYTVLIFTDVLMVLLSLRYSVSFSVTFRNFGYAVVTVFIRMALIAPVLINVLLGIGTALFALGMSYAYNNYLIDIVRQTHEDEENEEKEEIQEEAPATTPDESQSQGSVAPSPSS